MLRTFQYRHSRISRAHNRAAFFLLSSRTISSSNNNGSSKDVKTDSTPNRTANSESKPDSRLASNRTFGKNNRTPGFLVPKVNSTDHIQQDEVHTEGLFAGHRPLFLGELSVKTATSSGNLDGIFSTITKIKKVTDETKSSEIDIQGIISDLKSDDIHVSFDKSGAAKKPVIPWDASISGMVYNDEPFKDIPRTVVGRLKPFKLMRIERKNKGTKFKAPELIKLKFHNSKIDDEAQLIDINQKNHKKLTNAEYCDTMTRARHEYHAIIKSLSQFKFIRSDQHVFKTDVDKLNNLLVKEFHKTANLSIDSEFLRNQLPFYIYIEKSLSSKLLFQRFLKKRISYHIDPLLKSILGSYGTEDQAQKFEKRIRLKVNTITQDLSDYLPSVFFTGDVVDCVSHASPVSGFGRLHWLKSTKRRKSIWGKNIENDYVLNVNENYRMTRSGVKYMKYPISLHCKTFREAFTEWEYYT
ncbi:LANO_0H01046g1_1 [Lachancea nothofagi CBS 11611]|uniref:LANO_0H01046g1_1 n=1 Tax=Lachancea nothofagi CBS 11611 TaxID=1266666 RepID=A0A1G4KKY6_9SACH|nr:LANO_0H01046g1_1 [Lachancea nothofagi CBS 11611]